MSFQCSRLINNFRVLIWTLIFHSQTQRIFCKPFLLRTLGVILKDLFSIFPNKRRVSFFLLKVTQLWVVTINFNSIHVKCFESVLRFPHVHDTVFTTASCCKSSKWENGKEMFKVKSHDFPWDCLKHYQSYETKVVIHWLMISQHSEFFQILIPILSQTENHLGTWLIW
jgi:hypothetical protein